MHIFLSRDGTDLCRTSTTEQPDGDWTGTGRELDSREEEGVDVCGDQLPLLDSLCNVHPDIKERVKALVEQRRF